MLVFASLAPTGFLRLGLLWTWRNSKQWREVLEMSCESWLTMASPLSMLRSFQGASKVSVNRTYVPGLHGLAHAVKFSEASSALDDRVGKLRIESVVREHVCRPVSESWFVSAVFGSLHNHSVISKLCSGRIRIPRLGRPQETKYVS